MCDAGSIISLALAAYSANETRQQGQRAEKIAEVNARNVENDAVNVRNKGVEEENAHRLKVARLLAKQKAQFGAGGVSTDSGSASLILQDTKELGDADALRIRSNYIDKADSMDVSAGYARIQGEAARLNANSQATATLINGSEPGIASVADKWYKNASNDYSYGGQNDYVG